jgi:glycosyltransferase involved in cell wall biosynthesis
MRSLRWIEGLAHRRISVLLCNSRYLADFTRGYDLWPPPTRVIYNAVDLDRFRPAPLPPSPRPVVAVVANLHGYKRHDLFLRALAHVASELPAVRALLVGDGPERRRLRALSRDLGLESRVTFVGQTLDPRPYIADAHVVALTSATEGFPNALLEAMAMARPVVATPVGGVPEMVREGVEGLLVGSAPQAIAEGLLALLRDPQRLQRMSSSASVRARAFTWDRLVRETEALYAEVVARSARAPRERLPCAG